MKDLDLLGKEGDLRLNDSFPELDGTQGVCYAW